MPEHGVVEQELWCIAKFAGRRKGNSEEADTIVARHFPKHLKV